MSSRIAEPRAPRARRTQAERRSATRAALLDATVACLVEEGYANTTTRGIAQRAGVTPGALQHHFASKTELVTATVPWLSQRAAEQLIAQGLPRARSRRRLTELLLDAMWDFHKGPLIAAIGELYLAARNEPELRGRLAEAQAEVTALATAAAAQLFPDEAGPGQVELLTTVLATLRGLAALGYASPEARDAAWPATRAHLLRLLSDLRAGNARA